MTNYTISITSLQRTFILQTLRILGKQSTYTSILNIKQDSDGYFEFELHEVERCLLEKCVALMDATTFIQEHNIPASDEDLITELADMLFSANLVPSEDGVNCLYA